MAKQRFKTILAGRLVREALWSASFPNDSPKARAEKQKMSSAARQRLNDKASWQKLKMILAATFGHRDLVVTVGYDDAHHPTSREDARKKVKAFLTALRADRKEHGRELMYAYNIEQFHGNRRFHHMIVVNGTGKDYATIRRLWKYGTDVDIKPLEHWGYEELAKYMTKEAREFGRGHVGDRTWVCSRNCRKPEVMPTEWVSGSVRLQPPPNAYVLRKESIQNEWGSFFYLEYILPPEPRAKRCRPKA